ncbi:MAG: FprA family A-type flavoprotein [Butyrivibrio sp.]|nr:FprA family A-type flavoprotein [Acetatifactor muris]MCM1559746.1 FprA family A-type flavoprotein [Butyrivibrio sp.]
MKVTEDIIYAGVNDHEVDLFEGQYVVPNGMAYNSYVILDEQIAVMDTVDAHFGQQWLANVEDALQGRTPDYLIVQHMEPDHSANIPLFLEKYPNVKVAATPQAFKMMGQFFSLDLGDRQINAANGGELSLGTHTLQFVYAPMVHWPEVMMTYDKKDKVLFSADGFGKFGALDVEEEWLREARRYYFGIVGKFGAQVQAVLKKAAELDIVVICPLHGPILKENPGYYLGRYNTWSSYEPESRGVVIAYASIYGNTAEAAKCLAEELGKRGLDEVLLYDLARDDMAEAVADAFRYDRLVLASSTYNGGVFPFMRQFIEELTERNFQKRRIALIENGSWAPTAAKVMRKMLENCKELTFAENTVSILSAVKPENRAQIEKLAEELIH